MATFNGAEWIGQQIKSIICQEGVSLDFNIADDCSNDGTEEIARKLLYGREGSILKVNDVPSGSAGANFKHLFTSANVDDYDFVVLSDQDDIWLPNKLLHAINCMELGGADGYSCAVESFWPDGRTKILWQSPIIRSSDQLFEGAGQGCTFVLRKSFFKEVQLFCASHSTDIDEFHYHDWLVYLLARAWSKIWFFDPIPMIRYRQHESNEIGSRGGLKAIQRRLELIRNGWYCAQICAASRIYVLANGTDPTTLNLCQKFSHANVNFRALGQRLILSIQVYRHSRRKFVDRLVVTVGVLLGRI